MIADHEMRIDRLEKRPRRDFTGSTPYAFINAPEWTVAIDDPDFTDPYQWDGDAVAGTEGIDEDIFEYVVVGSPNGIRILSEGLYLVRSVVNWNGAWGPAVLQTIVDGPSLLGWASLDQNREGVYMGEGDSRFSFNLVSDQLCAVYDVPQIPVLVINNAFAGASERVTPAAMIIVRLSASPDPDQHGLAAVLEPTS